MLSVNVLKNTINSLKESVKSNWAYGDVNQWREYALNLKSIVNVSVSNLDSLLEYIENLEEEIKLLKSKDSSLKTMVIEKQKETKS